jgi:hypothetical protein
MFPYLALALEYVVDVGFGWRRARVNTVVHCVVRYSGGEGQISKLEARAK